MSQSTIEQSITGLVLAERQRQIAKWGKPNNSMATWLLILQEEMGELARGVLEDHSSEYLIEEAVQITTVFVAMGEWACKQAGWKDCEGLTEEVIHLSIGHTSTLADGDYMESYAALTMKVGAVANAFKNEIGLSSLSYDIRLAIRYGFQMVHRLQNPVTV